MGHRKETDLSYFEKGVTEYAKRRGQEEIPDFKHMEAQKYMASSGNGKFFV